MRQLEEASGLVKGVSAFVSAAQLMCISYPTELSSFVVIMRKSETLLTSTSIVWPPDTSRVKNGKVGGVSSVRKGVNV